MHKELLKDIGEKELINRLGKFMPKNQISDDCALIKTKNENLLVNTDSLVENVHFNDITICPVDLGWKAVVSNISDLLSSGSKKTIGITISLVLPAKTEWIWVEELGLYTETPTLPFATLGTLGWSHSNTAVDDGSSQFFFFLYEAELNPAGRNLIDGRNAAFGYVVDGFDVLEELTKDDTIISIEVLEGIENIKLNA